MAIRMFALLVAALLYFSNFQASLAGTVTVGTQNSANCIPFGCPNLFGVETYQQVYSSSVFSGVVDITSITFFDTTDTPTLPEDKAVVSGTYEFSFSTTDKAVGALDLVNLGNNIGLDSQVFFSGPLGGPLTSTEFTITGFDGFTYNPNNGNLLLTITLANLGPDVRQFFDSESASLLMSRAHTDFDPFPGNDSTGLVTRFDVTPIPIPAAAWLFGSALAFLICLARRNRQIA